MKFKRNDVNKKERQLEPHHGSKDKRGKSILKMARTKKLSHKQLYWLNVLSTLLVVNSGKFALAN